MCVVCDLCAMCLSCAIYSGNCLLMHAAGGARASSPAMLSPLIRSQSRSQSWLCTDLASTPSATLCAPPAHKQPTAHSQITYTQLQHSPSRGHAHRAGFNAQRHHAPAARAAHYRQRAVAGHSACVRGCAWVGDLDRPGAGAPAAYAFNLNDSKAASKLEAAAFTGGGHTDSNHLK